MKSDRIDDAIKEARRFIERATLLRSLETKEAKAKAAHKGPDRYWSSSFPVQSGAVRRASLDLTRSLAAMRRVE